MRTYGELILAPFVLHSRSQAALAVALFLRYLFNDVCISSGCSTPSITRAMDLPGFDLFQGLSWLFREVKRPFRKLLLAEAHSSKV